MTQNQIRLGELREAIRHNQAMEGAQRETNRINEEHYVRADQENVRHNLIAEGQQDRQLVINENTLAESIRHNKQSEAAAFMQAAAAQTAAHASLISANASQTMAGIALEKLPAELNKTYSEAYKNRASAQTEYSKQGQVSYQNQLYSSQTLENTANAALINSKTTGQDYTNVNILPRQAGEIDARSFETTTRGAKNIVDTVRSGSDIINSWVGPQAKSSTSKKKTK